MKHLQYKLQVKMDTQLIKQRISLLPFITSKK